jgi:hypothetical protein
MPLLHANSRRFSRTLHYSHQQRSIRTDAVRERIELVAPPGGKGR